MAATATIATTKADGIKCPGGFPAGGATSATMSKASMLLALENQDQDNDGNDTTDNPRQKILDGLFRLGRQRNGGVAFAGGSKKGQPTVQGIAKN